MLESRRCQSCGESISASARFCDACGADQIEQATGSSSTPAARYCSACGAGLTSDSSFCPECGARVEEVPTAPAPSAAGVASGRSLQPTQPWYAQTWAAVVALLFFFPLGLFLMWRFTRWEVWIKTVITIVGSLFTILVIVSAAIGGEDDGSEAVRQEESPSPTVEAPTATPQPTPSPEPTPEPTPQPTATPAPPPAPSYAFQLPSEFSEGSAERALAEYVFAWKNQDWSEMVKWSQKTWIDGEPDPAGLLEAWYDFKTLKGFEIKDVEIVSEVLTDITFVVHYEAIANQISKMRIAARVIRETAPYEPSLQGEWGVNPISALGEEEVP